MVASFVGFTMTLPTKPQDCQLVIIVRVMPFHSAYCLALLTFVWGDAKKRPSRSLTDIH